MHKTIQWTDQRQVEDETK